MRLNKPKSAKETADILYELVKDGLPWTPESFKVIEGGTELWTKLFRINYPEIDIEEYLKELDKQNEIDKKEYSKVFAYSPISFLLFELVKRKITFTDITWRDFEKLIAELLEKEGFEVTLGKGTKDGGVDIIAKRILPVTGHEITIWQMKHYKKGKVGIGAIRELADVRNQTGGHKGIMVTTSYLTKGALDRVQKDLYLDKKDRDDVMVWMKEIWDRDYL